MITPMKKLSLLVYHREKEHFLDSLQSLGVVHLVAKAENVSNDLRQFAQESKICEQVISALVKLRRDSKLGLPQKTGRAAADIIREYNELVRGREKLEQSISSTRKDLAVLEPWGEFEPASIVRLRDAGVRTRFFQASERKYASMDFTNLTCAEIARRGGEVFFIIFEETRQAPGEVPADEVRIPELSRSATDEHLKGLEAKLAGSDESIQGLTQYTDVLIAACKDLDNRHKLEAARIGMEEQAQGAVLFMSGWVPKVRQQGVADFLRQFSVWYEFTDPDPDDEIPVLLDNRPVPKLFEPIIKLYSLPDYRELDPTPFVAPFFAFFFGMCMGDVGYGLIVALIGIIGMMKAPVAIRPVMRLVVVLGAITMLCGMLLNTFFGANLFGGPGISGSILPGGAQFLAPLSPVDGGTGMVFPAMSFALVVGFVQVTFGIVLQIINKWRQNGFVHTLQPLGTILTIAGAIILAAKTNFLNLGIGEFAVGRLNLGPILTAPSEVVSKVLLYGGLGLIVFFNSPDSPLWIRPLKSLWEFYNLSTGLLSNILSYLRLFALGLAGGLLGGAFNQIAFMIITRDGQVTWASPLIVFTIGILIFGHALNLGLAAISSFAHPLRLTFVEFYGNVQFKGGAKPYLPFAKIQ